MSDFDAFLDAVKTGAVALAKDALDGGVVEARQDAEAFLKLTEKDLRRWVEALAQGLLTKAEFTTLVQGRKDLATIAGLTQLGLAQAKLERFRKGLIDLVIDSAFDAFLPG